jgi:hypothetical protein
MQNLSERENLLELEWQPAVAERIAEVATKPVDTDCLLWGSAPLQAPNTEQELVAQMKVELKMEIYQILRQQNRFK